MTKPAEIVFKCQSWFRFIILYSHKCPFFSISIDWICRYQLASINWYCGWSTSSAVTVTWSPPWSLPYLYSSSRVIETIIGPCLLIFTIFVCKCRDWSMQVQNSATSPFFCKTFTVCCQSFSVSFPAMCYLLVQQSTCASLLVKVKSYTKLHKIFCATTCAAIQHLPFTSSQIKKSCSGCFVILVYW